MNKSLKDILTAIGVIILYLVYGIFAIIPFWLLNIDTDNLNQTIKIIYLLFYESLFVFVIFMIYKKDMINDFKDFKNNYKKYLAEYIKYWFILLLLMYASNMLIYIIQKIFNHKEAIANNEQLVRDILGKYPIYMILSAVIIGPIEEEIVFRKTFRKIFNNKWLFIIISGLFFGAMHVLLSMKEPFDLLYIISYSIPGFIFAYVYYKSKNIFVNTSLHMIHNGALVTLQLLLALI